MSTPHREPPTIPDLHQRVSADRLRAWHDMLAAEPHVAGTPGDERVIAKIERAFQEMGLDVHRHEWWALLPRPVSAVLEILSPDPRQLILKEQLLDQDLFTQHPALDPGWNAFSGVGDVTGEIVYANYGRKEDFTRLAELGVEVRGKIVLARYGGNFRGYKARFAEKAGALGLIIYTDPADAGFAKGLLYPEGGFANDTCIERGSLLTTPYSGDPLTPGIEATKDAKRLDIAGIDIPHIPVQPVGYGAALEIMKRMTGVPVMGSGDPDQPAISPTTAGSSGAHSAGAAGVAGAAWQGSLPLPYRLTGGPDLHVRLKVDQDRQIRKSANVIGILRGSEEPDRMVIIGCHHDAWGYGAADPLAGTITLMESARIASESAKEGRRPKRSIAFCAWGGEEYGIIGSTEWVEGNQHMLATEALAYFNLDMASMGVDFGSSAAPSIRRAIAAAAGEVPQARDHAKTVREAWLARGKDSRDPTLPAMGDLGGGSDHIAFWCHIGVPSAGLSAGGSQGNSYHSIYDDLQWYRKVVGEDYEPAIMITRMVAGCALQFTESDLLPIEPQEAIAEFRRLLRDISARGVAQGMWPAPVAASAAGSTGGAPAAAPPTTPAIPAPPALAPLPDSLAALDALALDAEKTVRAAITHWRERLASGSLTHDQLSDRNNRLLASDRAWILTDGFPDRPWYRNTFAAPDRDSGYAAWSLPLLKRAVEDKDSPGIVDAVKAYESVLKALVQLVEVPE